MPPVVGTRFGRYELLDSLGAGGMGEVFRARDHDLHRDVAIKFLPERFASDSDRLGRFAQEARAASSLNHPNIITIHEIGEWSGLPYIVMELVEGETLQELLPARPIETRRLLEIASQLADGLAKAHAAGIVHRDLKPANVIVTRDRFVKILDFGLAKLQAEDPPGGESAPSDSSVDTLPRVSPSPQTTGGVVLGTAGYMSPEQARGRSVDFRSDQFALGVILYEMATGRRPFRRESPVQTLAAIIEDQPEPIAGLNPALPAPVCWIVERCLAKEPVGRYASTFDLARELRDVLEHLAQVGSSASGLPASAVSRPRWSRGLRMAGIALALFAVLAVVPALVPAVREGVALTLRLRPVPADKRLAILPFRAAGDREEDRALADGVSDLLTVRLTQLERFQKALSVEPTSNVRRSGVTSADTAARVLGVNLVVSGSVRRLGDRLVFTGNLEDALRRRTLRADSAESLEELIEKIVRMLDLEIGSDAKADLLASGTGVAEAATLSAVALGYNPYAEGRSALERFDQVKSLERAIELFNKALERDPRYALAHAGLGEAYWRLYRATRRPDYVPLAREHCERALALDNLLANAWLTLGILEKGTGHAEKAVEALGRALDRNPRSGEARRELGDAYEKLGRFEDARAEYARAIELRPDDWTNYAYLGVFLASRGQLAEAEAALRRGLGVAPDNALVWSNLGGVLYHQNRTADAQAALAKSIALFPTARAIANLGGMQFYEGRYADAARTYEKAVQTGTRNYTVWRSYASALYWAPGERERAAPAYRKAAELAEEERKIDPRNPQTLIELADCFSMLGEPERARSIAAEALKMEPVGGLIARTAAGIYEQLGDRAQALRWIGEALKAGYRQKEIESDPTFTSLRTDRRYVAVIAGKGSRPH